MSAASSYEIISSKLDFNNTWTIESYSSYISYLEKNVLFQDSLKTIIDYVEGENPELPFKWNLEIGSIQFLAGIFPKEKIIKLASKQLSFELSILHTFDKGYSEFAKIRIHAESIAEIALENTPAIIEYITFKNNLINFSKDDIDPQILVRQEELAQNLVAQINTYKPSLFEKFSDFGLDLTANFMLVRVHLLKFLAILPCLHHDKHGLEVKRILLETLRRLINDSRKAKIKKLRGQKRGLPGVYIFAFKIIQITCSYIPAKLLAFLIRKSVALMAMRFIAGESIHKAEESLKNLIKSGRDATIDQLGELVVSNKEADEYTEQVLKIILGLSSQIEKGAKNAAGINKAHVSIKVSALARDFKPQDYKYTYAQVSPRLRRILVKAKEYDVFVNIDAEHYHFRDIVFDIYKEVLLTTAELKEYAQTGIVVQAYLRDGTDHLNDVISLAKDRGICMPIRLVKGAYWDAESIEADAHNFDAPEFLNKEETDIHFRQLIYKTLANDQHLQLALASHNIQDHCFSEALRENQFPSAPVIEHQCLHMTYEALSVGLSKMNWPTRNYIPVGDLLVGMAYLVRRIMENSSQVGVLTIMRSHKKGLKVKRPIEILIERKEHGELDYDNSVAKLTREFKNIYPMRTYLQKVFRRVDQEVRGLLSEVKEGKLIYDLGKKEILCSSDPTLLLARIEYDSTDSVNDKIKTLFDGFMSSDWKDKKNSRRFLSLYRLADLMLEQREELSALIMLEAGKTIDEALADVDEACDFVHFYLREQIKLEKKNEVTPKGVVGVIAPWNFPLAISCGMSVAALCSGSSVILKPAEQTPLICLKLLELMRSCGITEAEFHLVLGEAAVGEAIVSHELVSGIVFTGSKQVGESIYKKVMGQSICEKYNFESIAKFAVTEMGGKNAIIVTNNCELDETVSGIIYSAFAHAGQKCSAASRIIIDNEVKESFISRFVDAVKDVKIGKAFDYSTVINPLITHEDKERVKTMAKEAKEEAIRFGGRVLVDESEKDYPGYCVGPSVFELSAKVVRENETVASREVFGPLIHIIGYDELDEAIEIFNSTPYALTGGIFCQSQDDIDYLTPKLHAGNLYINRPNTGARVAIEPFGGFKMSGTGPKAGSAEYLGVFNKIDRLYSSKRESILIDEEITPCEVQVSKLSYEKREEVTLIFLGKIVDQFERYFQKITEKEKDKLLKLINAIGLGEFDLVNREFPNRYIPGQVSFSKRDHRLGNGFLIDNSKTLEVQVFIDFLINLILGNAITVVAQNQELHNSWRAVTDLALRCGFSDYNISIGILNPDKIKELFRKSDFTFVIFTDHISQIALKKSLLERDFEEHLVRIVDSGFHNSWSDGITSFTHCRAYAINTMRHGAPLELTL